MIHLSSHLIIHNAGILARKMLHSTNQLFLHSGKAMGQT